MMVELGGGTNPHPRADIVIDLHHPKNAPAQDATEQRSGRYRGSTWPSAWGLRWEIDRGLVGVDALTQYDRWIDWDANSVSDQTRYFLGPDMVDEVYASHFIEHIPKGPHLIAVMNEAHRVLKPGGTLTLIMPLVGYTDVVGQPHLSVTHHLWADPTHVGAWWLPEGLRYFTGEAGVEADYGISQWAPLGHSISWAEADAILESERTFPVPGRTSWWSVRDRWEGVARLVKP